MQSQEEIIEYIFGAGSRLAGGVARASHTTEEVAINLTNQLNYEIFILIFLIIYFIWLGRAITNNVRESFTIANPFAPIKEAEGLGGSIGVGDRLLDWGLLFVMFALGATRIVDALRANSPLMERLYEAIVQMGIWSWLGVVATAFVIYVGWSLTLVNFMGQLLGRKELSRDIITIKSRLLMIAVVWLLPVILLCSFENGGMVMTFIATVGAVLFISIYIFRTFSLFAAQKISNLHWILYLCAVEIFPISFIWALFAR